MLNIPGDSPLHPIFRGLETHVMAAFNNYVQAIFNLLEFFRFADGAYCCLAFDPKVNSRYGGKVFIGTELMYMSPGYKNF